MSVDAGDPSLPLKKPLKPPKVYSCVLCAQRKVRCDKNLPCSNCVKARVQCVPSNPAPPQRRRRRIAEGEKELINRLKRYEKLLLSRGIEPEELDKDEATPSAQSSQSPQSAGKPPTGKLMEHGVAKFVESSIWGSLSEELLENEVSSEEEKGEKGEEYAQPTPASGSGSGSGSTHTSPDGTVLIFSGSSPAISLTALHPQPIQIFRLWQTFLDNVNPLVKILHAPTVQHRILEATNDLDHVSKSMEVLMFSIYCCAVLSLTQEECINIMGEDRKVLLARYHTAIQQGLVSAGFLKSSDLIVLQAFVLFLVSARQSYDPRHLWIFTGIAVRIGQRLGLHREATLSRIPAFEAEFRRRLWWQIILIEGRTAELSGAGTSVIAHMWDTSLPRNLNDSDMRSDMKDLPPNHIATTEMVFCLLRCEIGEFFRHSNPLASSRGSWQKLANPDVPVAEKDRVINELELIMDTNIIQYCDATIPLHLLTIGVAKSAIGQMRLMAHHPRQRPDRGASMSQRERAEVFSTSLMMMEQDNLGHRSKGIARYLWHINFNFQIDALAYMLSELRSESTGGRADRAWTEILEVFEHHPNLINDVDNQLYRAIGSLTLKSWEARESSLASLNRFPPEGSPPHAIAVLRSQRVKSTTKSSSVGKISPDSQSAIATNPAYTSPELPPPIVDPYQNYTNPGYDGIFDPSLTVASLVGPDPNAMDWTYWNVLFQTVEPQFADMPEQVFDMG